MNIVKKSTLATALAASALAGASPAMAHGYYDYGYRHHSDATGAAIAGGIIGLALGAIIASSGDHDRYRDYDYRRRGWEYRDGYYWDREGRRYDQYGRPCDEDAYYARRGYGDGYYRREYYRGW